MSALATTISASEARSNLYDLLNQVNANLKRFTITRRGQAQAIVIHPDEVAAWEETMEILADKKLTKQIFQSEAERKTGKSISEKKLFKELKITSEKIE